jgi:hypothetical protein
MTDPLGQQQPADRLPRKTQDVLQRFGRGICGQRDEQSPKEEKETRCEGLHGSGTSIGIPVPVQESSQDQEGEKILEAFPHFDFTETEKGVRNASSGKVKKNEGIKKEGETFTKARSA